MLLAPHAICRNNNICNTPQDEQPYIIEANPRASRTVPFVAKAVGHPIAKYASLLMAGKTLKDIGFTEVGCCCNCDMLHNMSCNIWHIMCTLLLQLAPRMCVITHTAN